MKIALLALFYSLSVFGQTTKVEINLEDVNSLESAKELGVTEDMIQNMIHSSREQLLGSYNIKNEEDLSLLSINH